MAQSLTSYEPPSLPSSTVEIRLRAKPIFTVPFVVALSVLGGAVTLGITANGFINAINKRIDADDSKLASQATVNQTRYMEVRDALAKQQTDYKSEIRHLYYREDYNKACLERIMGKLGVEPPPEPRS